MRQILLCLLLCVSLAAAADVYRWVDKDGNVHYGDTPRASANAELIKRTGPTPDFGEAEADEGDEGAEPAATPAPQKETPFAQGKETASAQERCDEFRARVTRYQNAGDMFIDQPDGTRHKLVGEERQRLIERTQQQANEACAQVN